MTLSYNIRFVSQEVEFNENVIIIKINDFQNFFEAQQQISTKKITL